MVYEKVNEFVITAGISRSTLYTYGNMITDDNKGIVVIYNHMNLPILVSFVTGEKITYLYDASGKKLKKTVWDGSTSTPTDYLSGFQYISASLDLFPTAEGYVKCYPAGGARPARYNYAFNLTDHLGNIRLTYGMDSEKGGLVILEENHYYPFGMKHEKYNSDKYEYVEISKEDGGYLIGIEPLGPQQRRSYQYKYNGKEFQDELELNFYDYGARNYDPAIGRWMNIDSLAEISRRWSPYSYCYNNPIVFVDPDGMQADDWRDKNGKEMTSKQLQDVKVYIFYNPTPNGKDGGFPSQTMQQYSEYEKQYGKGSVAISDAMTEQAFAQDWGDMQGSPEIIAMNHHGTNQALHLNTDPDGNPATKDGEYIVSTDNGKTSLSGTPGTKVSDLPDPKGDISNATLLLNTCNSNNTTSMKPGSTLAAAFSKDTGVGSVRGTNKKVNFKSDGNAVPQFHLGGKWQILKNGQTVNPVRKESPVPPIAPGLGF